MSDRDETLAGLAEVLAGHISEDHSAGNGYNEPREMWVTCSCGADIWEWQQFYNENPVDPDDAFRAHVAAVILAHLEAQGWAQGQEEWGLRDRNGRVRTCSSPMPKGGPESTTREIVRRRVTAWAPVETGEDA